MASPSTLQELQEDIDLYESLYNSCCDAPGMEADQEEYKRKLAELRARIDRMGQVWSGQNGRPSTQQSAAPSSRPSTATDSTPDNATASASKQYLSLPSRKRDRGHFDDDLDTESLHKVKSRRSTPAESPAISAVDSVGSDYFDNPELGNLLGDGWQHEVRTNREYLKQQEAKRRQQEEDERMARLLQEEFDTAQPSTSQPSFTRTPSIQATFRPNGSFAKPAPTPPQMFKPERQDDVKDEHSESPATVGSSDDDLTFVSPSEWNQLFPPATAAPSRTLPPTFGQSQYGVPGSYPSTHSAYTSLPGTSVYGTMPQSSVTGSVNDRLPSLGSLPGLPSLGTYGSLGNPFDLDMLRGVTSGLFGGMNGLPETRPWETVDPQETQEEIRQLLHNIRPDEEIDPSEAGENQPEGLKAKLMPHQVKGLAWMKKMEDGSNKGGILADDMGLGKTMQSIALMLSRPPTGSSKKPTLVVCPVALMDQWRREILKVVRGNAALTILLLHGQHAHLSWAHVKHYDVVLTSYGTLSSELRKKLNWEDKLKLNPDAKKAKKDEFPILDDKAFFHRIFLDEAQNIKNKSTKTAMAACRVNAEFRWCLSGTPMQNSVEEIYSLIKFLRIRPYNDSEKFSKDISRPLKARYETGQNRAMEKLQALLKAILLRRTKKSQIDGKPILQLPEKHTVETRAIFDKDQLDFYQALETQSQIQFNKFVKNGTVGRNYSKALVLLLRLRQCCCSPQLITNSADFVTDAGVEGIDLVANAKELPMNAVTRIKEQEDMECPVCIDAVENPIIFNPCGHALCHDCFSRMVDNVREENADNVKCPHCRARIDTKKITDFASFNDVYGDGPRSSEIDAEEEADESSGDELDSSDEEVESDGSDDGDDLNDFIVNDDASVEANSESEDEDDLDRVKKPKKAAHSSRSNSKPASKVKGKPKSKKRSKGKKKKDEHKSLADLRKEGLKSRAAKKKYLRQLGKIYEPCAKIDKTLELLNEIQNQGNGEKTIVFSSFTSFLDLVEVPLSNDHNLANYTRYDGSMTPKDRNEAVLRFTDDPHCRIMLVSLKAGNAGLNLTIANHVIILDPFWNPFVEHQAADRCHRIGQRREVTVHRVLIGEAGVDHAAEPNRVFTVEDRILALQEKKRKLVESALDENAASSVSRLGVRELGYLFGVSEMPRQN